MKKAVFTLFAILTFLVAGNMATAQSFPENWKSYDLSKYGMPFSIMAPASATFDWDGDSEELYIEAPDDRCRMMIFIDGESASSLVQEAKEETEENEDAVFKSYVESDANGFLAMVDYEGDADYELFYVIAKNGNTFVVTANPIDESMYSEEEGLNMYHACKKAME